MKYYGLIGYPLTHSFSKKYFTEKFERLGLFDHRYELFPIQHIEEIENLILSNPELSGLNVTIPYKEKVLPFIHELDETAKCAGAVNTIKIFRYEKLYLKGFNTDVLGFEQSLKPFLTLMHESALILGNGGAAKAVAYVLKNKNIKFKFVSRKPDRNKNEVSYSDINENAIKNNLLIINTTPLGMFPNVDSFPNIAYKTITPDHLCFDLVYNPEETAFMKKCKEKGAATLNGLTMLHQQAESAWEIWNS